MRRLLNVVMSAGLALASVARAQKASTPPRLFLEQDLVIDPKLAGGQHAGAAAAGADGRIIVIPNYFGKVLAYDSTGAALNWTIPIGGDKGELVAAERVGWAGSALWVYDRYVKQVLFIRANGTVARSLEIPSWVHPSWAERRTFPLFAGMEPIAVYEDTSMLVLPERPRSFFATPRFDRSLTHVLRVSSSGKIQREVLTLPGNEAAVTFDVPHGTHVVNVPYATRTWWAVSPNGMRIVVVPRPVAADSGALRVVTLNDKGDTIWTRRYPGLGGAAVTKPMADSALAKLRAVGTHSAEDVRAAVAKQIPAYRSRATGLFVGDDGSAWVMLRAETDTSTVRPTLVLDGKGDAVGIVGVPKRIQIFAADRQRMWGIERIQNRQASDVLRFKLSTTASPPAGSVKGATRPK